MIQRGGLRPHTESLEAGLERLDAHHIDHVGVVCRESPGFLVNRMQLALLAEIHRIVDEGLATPEDIDAAIRLSLGPRWALWGALLCEDLVVNKRTALAVFDYMREQTGVDYYASTPTLRDMIARGEIPAGSRVLYAHLGGVPAINGYSYLFRNG